MQNNRHVVIFARAPCYGRVKRRLAKDIGNLHACYFYRNNLINLMQELRVGSWHTHISLASAQDARHPLFSGMSRLVQTEGDLGSRMRSVLDQFKNKQVIIVGSDIHGISKSHIEASFSALNQNDLVFGPAFDGGFWLVGRGLMRSPGWRFMHGVRWSTSSALTDTLKTVTNGHRVAQVSRLHDIDDGVSFDKFYRRRTRKKGQSYPGN